MQLYSQRARLWNANIGPQKSREIRAFVHVNTAYSEILYGYVRLLIIFCCTVSGKIPKKRYAWTGIVKTMFQLCVTPKIHTSGTITTPA